MTSLQIDVDKLGSHSRDVQRLGDDVDLALGAVTSLNLSGGAFGVMCQFMVAPAMLATQMAVASIRSAGQMVYRTSDHVHQMALEFARCEEKVVAGINGLSRDMGR